MAISTERAAWCVDTLPVIAGRASGRVAVSSRGVNHLKLVRILGIVLALVVVGFGIAWLTRMDPMGPVSGRALSGTDEPYPASWDFSDDNYTIAVESRPDDPHSVTTIAWVHEGSLHIPAMNGSDKHWTQYVVADPRVRVKVGDRVFPATLIRIELDEPDPYLDSAAGKYAQMAEAREDGEMPEDIWLFRVEPR